MAFKTFKYKIYSKGYHKHCPRSRQLGSTGPTSFFDSSYQYLRARAQGSGSDGGRDQQNGSQGRIDVADTDPSAAALPLVAPHPVVVANNNYSNLDEVYLETARSHRNPQSRAIGGTKTPTDLDARVHATSASDIRRNPVKEFTPGTKYALIDCFTPNRKSKDQNHSKRVRSGRSSPKPFADSNNLSFKVKDGILYMTNNRQTLRLYSTTTVVPEVQSNLEQVNCKSVFKFPSDNAHSSPWEPDLEKGLNKETYLEAHVNEITEQYEAGNFNKVNALYMSLKRNGVVPDIDTFFMVIDSLARRSLDNGNLDAKMFDILTCYQDIIDNKLKPSSQVFDVVVLSLFKGSLLALQHGNPNGSDFFKIALELFLTVETRENSFGHHFHQDVMDHFLVGINTYFREAVHSLTLKNVIDICSRNPQFSKYANFSLYYIALLNFAKSKNDKKAIFQLYESYKNDLIKPGPFRSSSLLAKEKKRQIDVHRAVISGLVQVGETGLASNFFNMILESMRKNNEKIEDIRKLTSTYILSTSQADCKKGYELWLYFQSQSWLPEFSYDDFYLPLLSSSFKDWDIVKAIYNYVYPMEIERNNNSISDTVNLSEFLFSYQGSQNVLSSLLDYALQLRDTKIVMQVIEESIIKHFKFEASLYPFLFQFCKETQCTIDYITRFIQSHYQTISTEANASSRGVHCFLKSVTQVFSDQSILNAIICMPEFFETVKTLELETLNSDDFEFLTKIFTTHWNSQLTVPDYPRDIQLHAFIVNKLLDFEIFYLFEGNPELKDFKMKITKRFLTLLTNYKRFDIRLNLLPQMVWETLRLVDADMIPEELRELVDHYNQTDMLFEEKESAIMCLGSMIRNNPKTAIGNIKKLIMEGRTFDYDTYKELLKHREFSKELLSKTIETFESTNLGDRESELKYLSNMIISRCPQGLLDSVVLESPYFKSLILPHLKSESFDRLCRHVNNTEAFIERIEFPKLFKSITYQAEFKDFIRGVYQRLYDEKRYKDIINYNNICPVMDLRILLKSCINSGEFELFEKSLKKYEKQLPIMDIIALKGQYLISNMKVSEALALFNNSVPIAILKNGSIQRTGDPAVQDILDLYTFSVFLQTFVEPKAVRAIDMIMPGNTLQLANMLSCKTTFTDMMTTYQMVHESGGASSNMRRMTFTANQEICQQILNNLHDSLQFFNELNDTQKSAYDQKINNLFRFKIFLGLPHFSIDGIKMLLAIWSKVNPSRIVHLFNNIVESLYLVPETDTITFDSGITFKCNHTELQELISTMKDLSYSQSPDNSVTQVFEEFGTILQSNMGKSLNSFHAQAV